MRISAIDKVNPNSVNFQHKLLGLDLLRVVSALMVFLFHLNINLGFRTSIQFVDTTISVGANFMVAFIMLSGFTLSLRYRGQDLLKGAVLKNFYLKRTVFPERFAIESIALSSR